MKLSKLKILLVDDDLALLELMKEYLECEGAQVSKADHASSAYELIENEQFDYIISDICMPDITGIELLKKVRTELNDATPFILASGSSEYSEQITLDKGAMAFFPKPVNFKNLTSLLVAPLA